MPVDVHLFSTPGKGDIRSIVDACQPYIKAQTEPVLAFIQWASVHHDWLPYTRKTFAEMAEVAALNPDPAFLLENEQILDRCAAVYVSGGNTYLLNHLLHSSGLLDTLRKRALQGLPVVGFSAGAILCGPNILTTHDINLIPTRHFNSLELLPYNIVAHYPSDVEEQNEEDDWLSDYHAQHGNPILALEDDAYVRWNGEALKLARGNAWVLEAEKPRIALS